MLIFHQFTVNQKTENPFEPPSGLFHIKLRKYPIRIRGTKWLVSVNISSVEGTSAGAFVSKV